MPQSAAIASSSQIQDKDSDHRPSMTLPSSSELNIKAEISLQQQNRLSGSLVLGTRGSALALAQTYLVQGSLASLPPSGPNEKPLEFQVLPMSTAGDKNQTMALYLMGGKSLWTQELEVALLAGTIDLIVHSLKDVPTSLPDGCMIGAITKREDPRDCLVTKLGSKYKKLEDLPDGSVVGTSSVRRVAQLRRAYPKLMFADVRGNINTRLAKLDNPDGAFAAIVLAAAGLKRLNFDHRISSYLEFPQLYYAVGQGALGIEIRSQDPHVQALVAQLDDWHTSWTCRAERELLRCLEGGCSVPVGCHSTLVETTPSGSTTRTGTLKLSAIVASLSGERSIEGSIERHITSAQEAESVGSDLADHLISRGGKEILAELGRKVEDETFKARHEDAVRRAMERAQHGETLSKAELASCGADLEEKLAKSPTFKQTHLPIVNGH